MEVRGYEVQSEALDKAAGGWGACLVPGGRWLLVGGWDGSVTTYDLDASTVTGRPLITRDDQDERKPVQDMAINIDSPKQSHNLTFTMTLSPAVYPTSFPHKIHTWRVTLTGHSTEARLTANHLCSIHIQTHYNTGITGIAIHKNIFARILRQGRSYIEVFDWKRSTSSPHCKDIIFPAVKIDAVRLLPDDRLLAFCDAKTMIYSFVPVRVDVTAPTIVPHVAEPLWELPFGATRADRGALSEGFSDEIVVKGRNLHGLTIPHNRHQAPHFRQLMEFDSPRDPTYAIGFEKAFIQHMDRLTTRLSFSWEEGEAENMGSCPASSCVRVTSRDYITKCNGVRLPSTGFDGWYWLFDTSTVVECQYCRQPSGQQHSFNVGKALPSVSPAFVLLKAIIETWKKSSGRGHEMQKIKNLVERITFMLSCPCCRGWRSWLAKS
ncbi:hypothetical protein BDZ97DRAFT_2042290 [Flammula alnicola]|nr:hypothetical protein BDZ97DRAFT_2042290 [Flammula alnicola]